MPTGKIKNPKSQIQIYLLDFEIGIYLVVLAILEFGISIDITNGRSGHGPSVVLSTP